MKYDLSDDKLRNNEAIWQNKVFEVFEIRVWYAIGVYKVAIRLLWNRNYLDVIKLQLLCYENFMNMHKYFPFCEDYVFIFENNLGSDHWIQ